MNALSGRSQTSEHVKNRNESIARTKALWTPEKKAAIAAKVSEANKRRDQSFRSKCGICNIGRVAWNKGNNWRNKLTPCEVRKKTATRIREYRARTPRARINGRMRTRVAYSLKGKKRGRHWGDLVGYDVDALEARLKETMPFGYTWDDFLSAKLEIDHIRPVSSFRFESFDDIEFKQCWALSNLQLLPALENWRKGSKWMPQESGV